MDLNFSQAFLAITVPLRESDALVKEIIRKRGHSHAYGSTLENKKRKLLQ